jgi:hypothetical protein
MQIKKSLALALAAIAAGGGSAALADVKVSDDRRGDAKCDSSPCPDLKSAIANPAPLDPTSLFYIITQHNALQGSSLPRVAINTRGGDASAPEFYVEKRGARTGVFNAKTGRKVGAAALRPYPTSLSWTVKRRSIGNPGSYRWRVEVVAQGGSRIDATPNRGYLAHS